MMPRRSAGATEHRDVIGEYVQLAKRAGAQFERFKSVTIERTTSFMVSPESRLARFYSGKKVAIFLHL